MEVKSVSHRLISDRQSLRDREILRSKRETASVSPKYANRGSAGFLRKVVGADELIINKKTKKGDIVKRIIKNGESEADEANQKRIIASGILAGLVFASGYLICKRGS